VFVIKIKFEEVVNVAEVTLWVPLHRTDWNDMLYGKQKFVTVITIVSN